MSGSEIGRSQPVLSGSEIGRHLEIAIEHEVFDDFGDFLRFESDEVEEFGEEFHGLAGIGELTLLCERVDDIGEGGFDAVWDDGAWVGVAVEIDQVGGHLEVVGGGELIEEADVLRCECVLEHANAVGVGGHGEDEVEPWGVGVARGELALDAVAACEEFVARAWEVAFAFGADGV